LTKNNSPSQLALGMQLIEQGLKEFPRDSFMLFLSATYLDAFYGEKGKRKASRYIEDLKKIKPSFEFKFQVYIKERTDLENRKTSDVADGEQLHVLESAEFQNLDRRVKREHFLALTAVRDFWESIRIGADISKLSSAVTRLGTHGEAAKDCYNRLLLMYPKNKSILRSFAKFLFSVDGDTDRGNAILELIKEGAVPFATLYVLGYFVILLINHSTCKFVDTDMSDLEDEHLESFDQIDQTSKIDEQQPLYDSQDISKTSKSDIPLRSVSISKSLLSGLSLPAPIDENDDPPPIPLEKGSSAYRRSMDALRLTYKDRAQSHNIDNSSQGSGTQHDFCIQNLT
jgi:hypothetical protein